MYLVGQIYYDEKGVQKGGRIRAMPDDSVFTVIAERSRCDWDYGIYRVCKQMTKRGHPFRIVTPCRKLRKETFDALVAINEAQQYGDGMALFTIGSGLKKVQAESNHSSSVCDLIQVACDLLLHDCPQRKISRIVSSDTDLAG